MKINALAIVGVVGVATLAAVANAQDSCGTCYQKNSPVACASNGTFVASKDIPNVVECTCKAILQTSKCGQSCDQYASLKSLTCADFGKNLKKYVSTGSCADVYKTLDCATSSSDSASPSTTPGASSSSSSISADSAMSALLVTFTAVAAASASAWS